jgi:OOP family OmpA-OmpF porin
MAATPAPRPQAAGRALAPAALALTLACTAVPPAPAWAQGTPAPRPQPVAPAGGEQPVRPLPPQPAPKTDAVTRNASLPARGLFDGDRLTPAARAQLTDLVIDAIGRDVEMALLIPTGPWRTEGGARGATDERDLTPARIEALRRFLVERGIDRRRIYVESRVDNRLAEPRLDVQIVDRPAAD